MSIQELTRYIGRRGYVYTGGMKVEVNICDVKVSWGKLRYGVTPVAGGGEVWVENITLKEEEYANS